MNGNHSELRILWGPLVTLKTKRISPPFLTIEIEATWGKTDLLALESRRVKIVKRNAVY